MLLFSSIAMNKTTLYSSRKYPYPPQGRLVEIPRGREGGFKSPNFKVKYCTNLEFPQGVAVKVKKTFCGTGMDIFWNNTLQYA